MLEWPNYYYHTQQSLDVTGLQTTTSWCTKIVISHSKSLQCLKEFDFLKYILASFTKMFFFYLNKSPFISNYFHQTLDWIYLFFRKTYPTGHCLTCHAKRMWIIKYLVSCISYTKYKETILFERLKAEYLVCDLCVRREKGIKLMVFKTITLPRGHSTSIGVRAVRIQNDHTSIHY